MPVVIRYVGGSLWVDGCQWVGGWVGGWVDGWVGEQAWAAR